MAASGCCLSRRRYPERTCCTRFGPVHYTSRGPSDAPGVADPDRADRVGNLSRRERASALPDGTQHRQGSLALCTPACIGQLRGLSPDASRIDGGTPFCTVRPRRSRRRLERRQARDSHSRSNKSRTLCFDNHSLPPLGSPPSSCKLLPSKPIKTALRLLPKTVLLSKARRCYRRRHLRRYLI
jgi:hypothetical protein